MSAIKTLALKALKVKEKTKKMRISDRVLSELSVSDKMVTVNYH